MTPLQTRTTREYVYFLHRTSTLLPTEMFRRNIFLQQLSRKKHQVHTYNVQRGFTLKLQSQRLTLMKLRGEFSQRKLTANNKLRRGAG